MTGEKIIDNMTKNKAVYSEIGDELNDFNNDNVQFEQSVRGISENDTGRKEKTEQNDDTVTMIDQSAKSQDFFQNNKWKKERKYTTTRIKSRNFLSNIAYVGINREDFYN